MTDAQRYLLHVEGHRYELTASGRAVVRLRLLVDGREAATGSSAFGGTATLRPGPPDATEATADGAAPDATTPGVAAASVPWRSVEVLTTATGRVRRATVTTCAGRHVDLDPEPGSPAAARLARERAHPVRYAALAVLAAVARVLLPLLGIGALLAGVVAPIVRWVRDHLPHVDLPPVPWPRIPWPSIHLPRMPWPDVDLPAIPWPRLDLDPPPWVVWLLDHADQLWPVVMAVALARGEVVRQRRQDEAKAALAQKERRDLLRRLAADLHAVEERGARPGPPPGTDVTGTAATPAPTGSHRTGTAATHASPGEAPAPADRVGAGR